MVYLISYNENTPKISLDDLSKWYIVDKVCDGNSLIDINKFLKKKNLPIINNLSNFRIDGYTLVYFTAYPVDKPEYLYIIDAKNVNIRQNVRDYKLNKLT